MAALKHLTQALAALEVLEAMDPAAWDTGLSPEGARAALAAELGAIRAGLEQPLAPGLRPRPVLIWCADNVFTAPLRWLTWLAALGCPVTLKAPSAHPQATQAFAAAFAPLGARAVVLAHEPALALLDQFDAVLAFGADGTMQLLAGRAGADTRLSLHGHRVSFAVVGSSDVATARALALDAALYDGAGCMSPAAVFCLGDAEELAANLAVAMEELQQRLPRGPVDPAIGPAWRRRCGLARVLGRCYAGRDWAVPLLPLEHAEALVLPRMLPVHPLRDLAQLARLGELPLSRLATDLDAGLEELGFSSRCAPGEMQVPDLGPVHEGQDVLKRLLG